MEKEELKKFKIKMYITMIVAFILSIACYVLAIMTSKYLLLFVGFILFFFIIFLYRYYINKKRNLYYTDKVVPIVSKYFDKFDYNHIDISIWDLFKNIWKISNDIEIKRVEYFSVSYNSIEFGIQSFSIIKSKYDYMLERYMNDYLFHGKLFSFKNNEYINGMVIVLPKSVYEADKSKIREYQVVNTFENNYIVKTDDNLTINSKLLSYINELEQSYQDLIVIFEKDYVHVIFRENGGFFNVDMFKEESYANNLENILKSNADRVKKHLEAFKKLIK